MTKQEIRTRIAPSPTGPLHIGVARTALFNYLFAKGLGGKFILRFEDTDQERSKKEFEKDIAEGLKWLGLTWDEGPYYQSKDLKKYQKYADELIKKDLAYKKDGAIWFNFKSKVESEKLKVLIYDDLVHDKIEFPAEKFNDFVIIKSNGLPSFMFGNVIDDHEEKISHVIRGEDHITNTPQQILIYCSLGWKPPQYGHIPLILNQDRSKMSKRKDPVSISKDFRDQGYLPEAMINYMTLLGWSPKDNREFFNLEGLVREFDLKNVNKSGAIFDIEKLGYFNAHSIRRIDDKKLAKLLKSDEKIVHILKDRMTKLSDFEALSGYFKKLPQYKAENLIFRKSTREKTLEGLKEVSKRLSTRASIKSSQDAQKILTEVVTEKNLSNGDVFWPVRYALSAAQTSPSPTELMEVLAFKEVQRRIQQAIDIL